MSFTIPFSSSASSLAGRLTRRAALLLGMLAPALSSCDEPIDEADEADEVAVDEDELTLSEELEEELLSRRGWTKADDPRLLSRDFNYELDDLPRSGWADRVPWPGHYWPAYNDSINYRWAGSNVRSPAEKYGAAFGRAGVAAVISNRFGVGSVAGRSCRYDSDCGNVERVQCGRRRGESRGRCIERWLGICHAWAPAAIMEREPKRGITYNGVRFEISDLKALISLAYTEGLSVRLMSLRCNTVGGANSQACRDTNPGSFHVALANLLGVRGDSFLFDRTYDREVWTHPVVGYRVTHDQQVSAATANAMLRVGGSSYRFNGHAAELRRLRTEVYWINEASPRYSQQLVDNVASFTITEVYDYILELDAYGRIIGGEWVGGSKRRHPDFVWRPMTKRNTTVAGVVRYSEVEHLMQLAGGGR
ncbi:hypothetical protein [Nannocystis exedens]|uniref:hypothetical protein n=1 Tax=Nannocystis exedens TaxID=54 RepID=UPI000BBA04E1|nr:hypothetical protein [Nannocystis exedens]PCC68816.1 putative pre-peptidase C-terminal domain-containing protein [Nannocystis exedens]